MHTKIGSTFFFLVKIKKTEVDLKCWHFGWSPMNENLIEFPFKFYFAASYEKKFHEIFQDYWFNNRTMTTELRNVVKIPNHPNLSIEELPDCLSVPFTSISENWLSIFCLSHVYCILPFVYLSQPSKCLTCRAFTFSMLSHYQNQSDPHLDDYLYDMCWILVKEQTYVCTGLINIYGVSWYHNIALTISISIDYDYK